MRSPDDAVIRPASAEDAEAIRAIYEPAVNGTFVTFEEVAPDTEEIVRRMRSRPRLPWLVAGTADGVVGYARAIQHRVRPAYRWSAESSVYVAETHRGRGIGRRLYERLATEVRDLGYVSMFSGVALPNAAAWHCTNAWVSVQSGCSPTSDTSSAPGTMSAGGSCRCGPARRPNRPNLEPGRARSEALTLRTGRP